MEGYEIIWDAASHPGLTSIKKERIESERASNARRRQSIAALCLAFLGDSDRSLLSIHSSDNNRGQSRRRSSREAKTVI